MILIAAFAIYAILVKRIRITRTFTLTGPNARVFGFALLILLIPAVMMINAVMRRALPPDVLGNPIATRLIGIAALGVMMFALAVTLRDRPDPQSPSDPSNTAT